MLFNLRAPRSARDITPVCTSFVMSVTAKWILSAVPAFMHMMWKVAPALATGNTFVYKPSPLSPWTAVMLGQVMAEAGLPPGVFGVVQGAGETGALMTKHPGFAKFSFTGSVPTGTKIMQAGQFIFCYYFTSTILPLG